MKGNFSSFNKKQFASSAGIDENTIKNQFNKYSHLNEAELTKMFFDLAAKEKASGRSGQMQQMIEQLRPMLNSSQRSMLDNVLKNLK